MTTIVKRGLFYRIIVNERLMSKRRFRSSLSAFKYYYSHQDKYGFPTVERKGKWLK